MNDDRNAGPKSAKILSFPRGRAHAPADAPLTVMSEAKQRALGQLAERLTGAKLRQSDREIVARNWHRILEDLKGRARFKNRAEIYDVLLRKGSSADSQKMAFYYELSESIGDEDVKKRKITQSGRKWLTLAEQAAKLDNQHQHHFLPGLLERTSLAPGQSESTLDTPDEIRAVLTLAAEACRSVAATMDVESYFRNWSRMWVGHRRSDDAFRAGAFVVPPPDWSDEGNFSSLSNHFYELTEEIESCEYWTLHPRPSARIALCSLLGPLDGQLIRYVEGGGGEIDAQATRSVRVTYTRDYRLAFAINALTDALEPALEIRDDVRIWDESLAAFIPFQPDESFTSASCLLENEDDEESSSRSVHCGPGTALLPEGRAWCHVHVDVDPQTIDRIGELAESSLFSGGYGTELLENHYCLLTPGSLIRVLSRKTYQHLLEVPGHDFTAATPDENSKAFEGHPTLTTVGTLLWWLERALLGGKEGPLYRELSWSAQDKVQRFNEEYQKVLRQVLHKHDEARASFAERQD